MSFLKFTVIILFLSAMNLVLNFYPNNIVHNYCLDRFSFQSSFNEFYLALVCGKKLPTHSIWKEKMSQLGLLHFFVVSGAHLIFVENFLNFLTHRFKPLKKITIPVLTLLMIMNDFQAPIVRAWSHSLIKKINKKHILNWSPPFIALVAGLICLLSFPNFSNTISLPLSWCAALIVNFSQHKQKVISQTLIYLLLLPLLSMFSLSSPLIILTHILFSPIIFFVLLPISFFVFLIPKTHSLFTPIWSSVEFLINKLSMETQITYINPSHLELAWIYLLFLQSIFLLYKKKKVQNE